MDTVGQGRGADDGGLGAPGQNPAPDFFQAARTWPKAIAGLELTLSGAIERLDQLPKRFGFATQNGQTRGVTMVATSHVSIAITPPTCR
jgi:hypothetical protein